MIKMQILDFVAISVFMGIIASICGIILIRFYIPKMIENEKNLMKFQIEQWLNSETGHKALYMIGGLVAGGLKGGLNLNAKGGKFKFENIIAELAGQFIQSKVLPNIGNMSMKTASIENQPQNNGKKDLSGYKSKY